MAKMILAKWNGDVRLTQRRHINWVRMCYFLAAVHPTRSSHSLKSAQCHCQFRNEYPLLVSDTSINRQLAGVDGKVDKHNLSLYANINSLFTSLLQQFTVIPWNFKRHQITKQLSTQSVNFSFCCDCDWHLFLSARCQVNKRDNNVMNRQLDLSGTRFPLKLKPAVAVWVFG